MAFLGICGDTLHFRMDLHVVQAFVHEVVQLVFGEGELKKCQFEVIDIRCVIIQGQLAGASRSSATIDGSFNVPIGEPPVSFPSWRNEQW